MTKEAVDKSLYAQFSEELSLAVLASYDTDRKLDLNKLTENLSKIDGITDKNGNLIGTSNPITSLPTTVKKNNQYSYKIIDTGEVKKTKNVNIVSGLDIGSYVTYNPPGDTYTWSAEYSSSDLAIDETSDVELDSRVDGSNRVTSWRVFKIDEDEGIVQIVPATKAGTVRLQGAQGYNNGVQLLNEACSTLYSDSSKEIIARHINVEDIASLLQESTSNQNSTTNYTYLKSYSYYPRIYEEEINSVINGNQKTSGLSPSSSGSKLYSRTEKTALSSQTTEDYATNGYFQASKNISPYGNNKFCDLTNNNNFLDSNMANTYFGMISPGDFWLATRSITISNIYCDFRVMYLGGGGRTSGEIVLSSRNDLERRGVTHRIFPIVSVDSSLIIKEGNNFYVNN